MPAGTTRAVEGRFWAARGDSVTATAPRRQKQQNRRKSRRNSYRQLHAVEPLGSVRLEPGHVLAEQLVNADVNGNHVAGGVADHVFGPLVGAAEGQPADRWRGAVQPGIVLQALDRLAVSVTRGRALATERGAGVEHAESVPASTARASAVMLAADTVQVGSNSQPIGQGHGRAHDAALRRLPLA